MTRKIIIIASAIHYTQPLRVLRETGDAWFVWSLLVSYSRAASRLNP